MCVCASVPVCSPLCAHRLEVDLLMGSFAVEHVPKMTLPQLQTYERILACETVDLFTFLSGQMAAPEVCALSSLFCLPCIRVGVAQDLKGDVLDLLLKHVNARPVGQSSPKVRVSPCVAPATISVHARKRFPARPLHRITFASRR